MACERKLIESEATTGFFVLLGTKGKKETLEWCMKANLIASRYECSRFKKKYAFVREGTKGTVDGYEWRCRNQSKDNRHDVVRSIFEKIAIYKKLLILYEFVNSIRKFISAPDNKNGRGNLVGKVMNSWPACHEFEPSTAEDPQCREAMHEKSIDA
ncbi:hypothetical protein TNCV_2482271 [Trichonephila clavipes]|nr:hypothetical protein TNCV_2482271 [Trichonephila clavipes]